MNIAFAYINRADAATVTPSSEHLSFPAENVQHRWFVKPWRSRYGAASGWGLFRITAAKNILTFSEGGGNLTATITTGDYDADSICIEIKTQMEVAGALTYTVTYDDTTNLFTIAGSGAFILVLSVTTNSIFPALGWAAAVNTASLASHTAPAVRIHTEEELRFDLGSSYNLYFISIKNHNLQSGATIQVRFYSDAFITLAETATLTWKAGLVVSLLNQYYRYVAVHVVDPDNPDLYVEMGRVWIGAYFQPRIGFSMERERVQNDPSVIAESENGQVSTIQRTKFDTWSYNFEGVDPDDKDDIEDVFQEVGASKALFICEDPEAADLTLNTKYVTIVAWQWDHLAGEWWKLALELKEER
jgi:hypothetical protein